MLEGDAKPRWRCKERLDHSGLRDVSGAHSEGLSVGGPNAARSGAWAIYPFAGRTTQISVLAHGNNKSSSLFSNKEIPEVHRPKKRPLQAIPAEPIPEELSQSLPFKQREIPIYTPPLEYIEYKAGTAATEASDERFTFLLLFSEDCITRIVSATNSYAEYNQNELSCDIPREWILIARTKILRFIGCLFYIGIHRETLRKDY
jgi:hypothetical protein